MSKAGDTFFTAVGCMDGRVQGVIARFGQKTFGAKYPDTITEAGIVGLIGKESLDQTLIDSIKFKIGISVEKHKSNGIIVHGHEECAGNPVDEKAHKDNIRKSVEVVKKLVGNKTSIVGVYVKRADPEWIIEELH